MSRKENKQSRWDENLFAEEHLSAYHPTSPAHYIAPKLPLRARVTKGFPGDGPTCRNENARFIALAHVAVWPRLTAEISIDMIHTLSTSQAAQTATHDV